MRKWYKRRGGFIYLPRIPWGQRPKWYRKIKRFDPYEQPEFHVPPEVPWQWTPREKTMERIMEEQAKNDSIPGKYRVRKVTTVPLTSDQKKLLEVTKPKSDRRKKEQAPKGAKNLGIYDYKAVIIRNKKIIR